MRRPPLFVILSFLLLFMQQQAAVHALSHLGPQLAHSSSTEFVVQQADETCLECALLSAGTSGVLDESPAVVPTAAVTQRASLAYQSRTADFPASFSSRAPPVLL